MSNVRKAVEFKLEDLQNVSDRTLSYIEKQKRPLVETVRFGRLLAYGPSPQCAKQKWTSEFVPALDAAGFIRHDIGPDVDYQTFAVASFYTLIHMSTPDYPSLICNKLDLFHSNETYESFQHLTNEQIEEVCQAIIRQTTPEEWGVIKLCGGFTGEQVSWSEAARRLNSTSGKIHTVFFRTMKRLSFINENLKPFPQVFDSPEVLRANAEELTRQLARLHKNPIFAEEARLKAAIEEISAKIERAASSES